MSTTSKKNAYLVIKRLFDILLCGTALLIIWPVMLIIALLVRRDGAPAIYAQTRIGRHGHPFSLYKFRSMTDEFADAIGRGVARMLLVAEKGKTRTGGHFDNSGFAAVDDAVEGIHRFP